MAIVVPPVIPGNSGAMRDLARSLRRAAGSIGSAEAAVTGDVRGMTFDGPAGDAFKGRARGLASTLGTVVSRLTDLAGRIERAADDVDASQRAHDAAVDEQRRELEKTGAHQ